MNASGASRWATGLSVCALLVGVAACGGGGGGDGGGGPAPAPVPAPVPTPAPTYTVGGTVSGLNAGSQVTLTDAAGGALATGNGAFTLPTALAAGSNYLVAVSQQPTGQTCTVAQGAGSAVAANVTQVAVTCAVNAYRIGGTVSGLVAGGEVRLLNNGGDTLTVNANGPFIFPTSLAYGGAYAVTVAGQPTSQSCALDHASGSGLTADVAAVTLTCRDRRAFVFALAELMAMVTSYAIGSDGKLTETSGSPHRTLCAPGQSLTAVTTVSSGRLYAVCDAALNAYGIGPDGELTAGASVPLPAGYKNIASAPNGRVLAVVNQQAETITSVAIAADGTLSAQTPLATGTQPFRAVFTPDGQSVYAVSPADPNTGEAPLARYRVAADGSLTAIGTQILHSPQLAPGLSFIPDGSIAYSYGRRFAVGQDGSLTYIDQPAAGAIVIAPDGQHLYGARIEDIDQFALGAGGALTALTPPSLQIDPIATQFPGPVILEGIFAPDGKTLYYADDGMMMIRAFSVQAGGTLSNLGTTLVGHPRGLSTVYGGD